MNGTITISPVHEEMSDWFNKFDTTKVITREQIARKLGETRKKINGHKQNVTQEDVLNMVSKCRVDLELRHRTTLVNVRGYGYKLANPDELAIQTAKWVKRTILYADRTYRLVDITDRRKIPGALKKVFCDNEGRIKTLSSRGKRFVESFVDYAKRKALEDKRKEVKDEK